MWLAPLGHVGIELLLEVRDNQHAKDIQNRLTEANYSVTREGHDPWT